MESVVFNTFFVFLYLVVAVVIALCSKKLSIPSLENYAIGYSSVATPVLIAGFLGSVIGAGTIMGGTGKLYSLGLLYAATLALRPVSWFIASKIFPNNLSTLKARGCLSISHVMYHLYGSAARWATTILTLLTELGIVAAQMIAVSYVLSNFLLIPSNIAAIISLLMIMGFSLMGGIRTIAQTGLFQFGLFFLLFPVSYLLVSHQHGGFQALNAVAPFSEWGLRNGQIDSSMVIFLIIFALIPDCSSSFIQKCLIARNKKQLESALKLIGQTYIPIIFSLCVIAYLVKATAPEINPDQALFYYINEMCPFWIKGLLSISVIAIIMGMSDGILHSTSVIFANDIVKVLRPNTSERMLIIWAKISIILLSSSAFFLINYSNDTLGTIWTMHSVWFPIILVPLCVGFAGFITDKKSFVVSALTAAATICLCYYLGFSSTAVFAIGIFASFISFFGAHMLFKAKGSNAKSLKNYFTNLKVQIKAAFLKTKARIARDLFPEEDKMLLGQKLIYNKFCVAIIILFFIYSMLMSEGIFYKVMSFLLGVGYVLATVLMLREIVFRNTNKLFYILWYGLLIIWSTVSSYVLIDGGVLMTSIAGLALLMLIVFTNAMTYLFSTIIGFSASALIYHLNIGEIASYQFYLTGLTCMLVGYFFLRPQEEVVKDRVAEQQMMLGTMAHELTSPQAAAEMSLDMVNTILKDGIRKKLKDGQVSLTFDEESLKMLETFSSNALKSTKAGIKIVKMLLMVSKTDKVELPKELFNMQACVQKAIESYIASNKSATNKISLNIDKDWQVNGPKDFVEQVIHNLVKNSFVHGGKRPDLQVKVYNDGNRLIIEDNGMGIPAEYLPFIFERFFSKSSSGTGIGLALSKMVAESMGGNIVCESQIGNGSFTRFMITIP